MRVDVTLHRSPQGAFCWWVADPAPPISIEPVERAVFAAAQDRLPTRLESHLRFEPTGSAPVVATATIEDREIVDVDVDLSAIAEWDDDGAPKKTGEVA